MCHAVRYYIFADVNIYVLQIILNPAFKNRIVFAVKKNLIVVGLNQGYA
jgi:hypothetical protein